MSVTPTTMTIDAHFNAGPHSGTEHFEAWLRNTLLDPDDPTSWVREADVVVGGVADLPVLVEGLISGIPYDVACRLTRSGAAQAGSTSSDPDDWPGAHRQNGVHLTLDDPVDDGSFIGDALGGPGVSAFWCALVRAESDTEHPNLFYEFEVDTGGGYVPLDGVYNNELAAFGNVAHAAPYGTAPGPYTDVAYTFDSLLINPIVEPYAGTTIDIRVRRVTRSGDLVAGDGPLLEASDWTEFLGLVIPP